MIDTLITHMHSKRVSYVHVCYLLLSVDFTVSFQHAAASDTHVSGGPRGAGVGGGRSMLSCLQWVDMFHKFNAWLLP